MIEKVSFFTIIFLVSISLAYSASVDVKYPGSEQDISYINENIDFVADVIITTDNVENVDTVQVEEIGGAPRFNSQCVTGCRFSTRVLEPEGELSQTFTILYFDSEGNQVESEEVSVSFESDTVNPEAINIQTNVCDDDACYISPSVSNVVELELSEVNSLYSKANVWLSFLGTRYKATNCQNTQCEFLLSSFSCEDGQELELSVHGDSESNAKNKVSNTLTQNIVCVTENPTISNVKFTSSRDDGILTVSDSFSIEVQATHSSSNELTLDVNASSLGIEEIQSTSCSKENEESNEFTCDMTLTSELINAIEEARIEIIVRDIIGNQIGQVNRITLAMRDDETIPTFWEFESYDSPIDSLSRRNMKGERGIPAEFSFTASRNNIDISDIVYEGGCEALHNPGSNDINKIRFSSVDDNKAKATVFFAGDGNREESRYDWSRVDYRCPISIQSRTPSTIFSAYETVNATISLAISDDPFVSQGIEYSIQESLNEIETKTNRIETFQDTTKQIRSICKMYGFGNLAVSGIAVASEGVNVANAATGGLLTPTAESLGRTKSNMQNSLEESLAKIKLMCDFMSCQSEYNQIGPDKLSEALGGVTSNGDFLPENFRAGLSNMGINSYADTLDPFQNKYVAWLSACIPALSYHWAVEREVECKYVDCLQNDVRNLGIPSGYCGYQKQQTLCKLNAGSIQSLIPGLNLLDNVKREVAGILENPIESALAGLVTNACKVLPDTTIGAGACTAAETLAVFGNIQSVITQGETLLASNDVLSGQSACDTAIDMDTFQVENTQDEILEAIQSAFGNDGPNRALEVEYDGAIIKTRPGTILFPDGTRARYNGKLFGIGAVDPEDITLLGPNFEADETLADKMKDNEKADRIEDNERLENALNQIREKEQERWNSYLDKYEDEGGVEIRGTMSDINNIQEPLLQLSADTRNKLNELNIAFREGDDAKVDQLANEIEANLNRIDELQTELETAEDKLTRQERDLRRTISREALVGTWGRMTKTFIGAQRGARFFSPFIGGLVGKDIEALSFSNMAEQVLDFDPFIDTMCSRDFNVEDATGDKMRPRTTSFTAQGSPTSSYVTATVLEIEDSYQYFVRNMIGAPKQDLSFSIVLEGEGSSTDITEELFGTPTVAVRSGRVGGNYQGSVEPVELSERKDRVCVQFILDDHISNYFDDVSNIEGNKFCQLVVEE